MSKTMRGHNKGVSFIEFIIYLVLITTMGVLLFNGFDRMISIYEMKMGTTMLQSDLNQIRANAMTLNQVHKVVFEEGENEFKVYIPNDAADAWVLLKTVPLINNKIRMTAVSLLDKQIIYNGLGHAYEAQGLSPPSTSTINELLSTKNITISNSIESQLLMIVPKSGVIYKNE